MRAVSTVVVAFLALVIASRAEACSCSPREADAKAVTQKALNGATAVFLGYPVVIRLESVPINLSGRILDYRDFAIVRTQFRVLRSWKGVDKPLVWLQSNQASGCDVEFTIGVNYLIYANVHHGELTTTPCHRTRPETDGYFEMERLGPPKVTFPNTEDLKW